MTDCTNELSFTDRVPPRTREVTEPSKYDRLFDKAVAVKNNTAPILVIHKGTPAAAASFAYRLRQRAEKRPEKFDITQTKDNVHVQYINEENDK